MQPQRLAGFVALLLVFTLSAHADESQLEKLIAEVKGTDSAASIEAIDTLAGLGAAAAPAVPALTAALQQEKEVRWHACRALGAIGEQAKAAVPQLAELLDDESPQSRAYAAFALGRIGKAASPAVDDLIENAFDEEEIVRRATQRALLSIDPPIEKTLPLVLKVLEEGDASTILPAVQTLAEQGKQAVPRLRAALKHENAQYWACLALAEIGADAAAAVPDLKELLSARDPDVRLQALVALGEIGEKTSIPKILQIARDDEFKHVRYAAVFALGKLGTNREARAALEEWMKSDDPFLRVISGWAAARANPGDKALLRQAIALAVDAFKSEDIDVRRAASRAVIDFRVDAETAGPLLVEALADEDESVVSNAVAALAALGPEALDHIDNALNNKDLRNYAVLLISRLGPEAASAVPALVESLTGVLKAPQENAEYIREVHFALGQIGPAASDAVPVLMRALGSEVPEIGASAAYALGKIGSAGAVPALQRAENSDELIVRAASVFALWKIQSGRPERRIKATSLLLKVLDEQEDPLIRAGAAIMLGELRTVNRRVKNRLMDLRDNDPEAVVRQSAGEALQKLD